MALRWFYRLGMVSEIRMASINTIARGTRTADGKVSVIIEQRYGGEVEYCQIDGNPLVVCAVYGHNKTLESGLGLKGAQEECGRDHATTTGVSDSCGSICAGSDVLTQLRENFDSHRSTPPYLANRAANEIARLRGQVAGVEALAAKIEADKGLGGNFGTITGAIAAEIRNALHPGNAASR